MTALRLLRYGLWTLVVGAAIGVVGLWMGWYAPPSSTAPGGPVQPPRIAAAIPFGGPFELVSDTGETVSQAALKDGPSLMFFGFTFCPDVCPTTLFEISNWLKELGPAAEELDVFFVTVDPERDTPEQLASYLSAFDERITGLTGTPEAVSHMLDTFRIYRRKVPTGDDDYTMDHPASVYLVGGDGSFRGTVDMHEDKAAVMAKLRRLVGEPPPASASAAAAAG